MKKTLILIFVLILITTCFSFVSCGHNTPHEDEELVRAKSALSKELEPLNPSYDGENITYLSHTYFTVEETGDGGHMFAGKIYFADKYGNKYYANYDAFVGKESWFPEINISEIVPAINFTEK